MVTRSSDSSHFPQGDDGMTSAQPLSVDQLQSRAGNTVFKSGPLFISSKGIGWTSWKKRWFILTRTSLVFFRSDPNAVPQKGGEANLTLGGIDLNSSGSVVIRADKKLLTVLFPDGRDGRAFTLKAETSEDMYEWKTALENALAQAPSGATAIENTLSQAPRAALLMGNSGSHRDDAAEAIEGAFEQWRDKRPVKSVVGTAVLFALEDDDGSPSFLEKALRFIEQYGVKVEGIFRQAADVDDVERRIHEFEQGRNEFSPDEDAHVIADCVKHILREMSSAPIPATCCSSLLDAFKRNQGSRVNAMRDAIFETFPEPNRHLLQRILKMMRIVASHKSENLMSTSAVAACMAPLLLRPLLAGDCEVEDNFDVGGDGSIQLLQAAAAANHAQAIVIILLEEFRNIFLDDEGSFSTESYSGSEGSGDEDEIFSDDEVLEDGSYNDEENDIDLETEEDYDSDDLDSEIETGSETEDDHDAESDLDLVSEVDPEEENEQEIKDDLERKQSSSSQDSEFDNKVSESLVSDSESPKVSTDVVSNDRIPTEIHIPLPQHHEIQCNSNLRRASDNHSDTPSIGSQELLKDVSMSMSPVLKTNDFSLSSPSAISPNTSNETLANVKRTAKWGRTAARKDLSAESLDDPNDEEVAIRDLEITKAELQNNIAKEARENATSLANLKGRKQAFHERRLALEKDVARLQEQLQKEKDLREIIEAGPNMPLEQLTISSIIDGKIRAEIEELAHTEADVLDLKQKAADLQMQLNQYLQQNPVYICESCKTLKLASNHQEKIDQEDFKAIATEHCQRSPRHKSPEKQKQPELATNDSTKFTMATCLSSESENAKTRSLSSTKKQVFQNQLTNSKRHNRTKSVDTMASSFSNFEDIVKHDQSASSNKKPLQKQQTDVKNYKNTKSTADTTSSTDDENVPTQDPTRLPNKQLSRKQWRGFTHHRSTKSTETIASPSAGSQDVITQDPPLSKKQPSKKLQKDPLSGSTKSTDAKTSSSNEETSTIVHNVSSSKRSTGKGEGTASGSSALTRLTKGFNFLKDKRPQNTNELQTLDASGNPVPEHPKPGPPQRSHSG